MGRAIGKPNVQLCESDYKIPSLEWFQIYRGTEEAGELLATFEMFEVGFIYFLLFTDLSVSLSLCLSVSLSLCFSLHLLSVYLYICTSVYLSLSICLFSLKWFQIYQVSEEAG